MSRLVVLACLCVPPIAGLLRQAEAAESYAATRAELARPGSIDPAEPPHDQPSDSVIRASASFSTTEAPSALDGLIPLPRLDHRTSIRFAQHPTSGLETPPPESQLRRLCRLQVFRN